jgi:hypothetical protein
MDFVEVAVVMAGVVTIDFLPVWVVKVDFVVVGFLMVSVVIPGFVRVRLVMTNQNGECGIQGRGFSELYRPIGTANDSHVRSQAFLYRRRSGVFWH